MQFQKKILKIIGAENIEFLTHAKNYLSAQMITMILGFISVPIFTRLLSQSEYGILSVFTSFTAIFSICLGLNIHGSILRYYHETSDDFDSFLGSNIIFIAIFNIITVFILYLLASAIAGFVKIKINLLFASILLSAIAIPLNIFLNYLIAAKKSKRYSIIAILKDVVFLILAVIWVWSLEKDLYWGRIYSSLLITTVFSFYAIFHLLKLSKLSLILRHVKYSLKFGLPLIPHAISGILLSHFDRIMINQLVSDTATGLYDVAYKVGMIMIAFVMATNKSWVPIFYDDLKNNRHEKINHLAANYTKYMCFIAIGLILFSKEIVTVLADKKFHASLDLIPIIVLSHVFVFFYTLYANFSFYRKKTILISLNTLIACGANIGLNYWLIPQFGYGAAAYTTLASYFLLFILHYVNAIFVLKERVIPLFMVIPNLLLVCGAIVAIAGIDKYVHFYYLALILKIVLVIFAGWLFFLRGRGGNERTA